MWYSVANIENIERQNGVQGSFDKALSRQEAKSRCNPYSLKVRQKYTKEAEKSSTHRTSLSPVRGYTAKEAITGLSLEDARKSWGERTNGTKKTRQKLKIAVEDAFNLTTANA